VESLVQNAPNLHDRVALCICPLSLARALSGDDLVSEAQRQRSDNRKRLQGATMNPFFQCERAVIAVLHIIDWKAGSGEGFRPCDKE